RTPVLASTIFYAAMLLALPAGTITLAAAFSRWWAGCVRTWRETALRFSFALVPLGASMWLPPHPLPLLATFRAILPAAQRAAQDIGLLGATPLDAAPACCIPVAGWLLRLEILFLDLGLLLSLYSGYRTARDLYPKGSGALRALVPWAVLFVLL